MHCPVVQGKVGLRDNIEVMAGACILGVPQLEAVPSTATDGWADAILQPIHDVPAFKTKPWFDFVRVKVAIRGTSRPATRAGQDIEGAVNSGVLFAEVRLLFVASSMLAEQHPWPGDRDKGHRQYAFVRWFERVLPSRRQVVPGLLTEADCIRIKPMKRKDGAEWYDVVPLSAFLSREFVWKETGEEGVYHVSRLSGL